MIYVSIMKVQAYSNSTEAFDDRLPVKPLLYILNLRHYVEKVVFWKGNYFNMFNHWLLISDTKFVYCVIS